MQSLNQTLAALALLVAAGIAVGFCEIERFEPRPQRFAEVEVGHVFRGGYPEPAELRWIVRQFGVRRVVSLMKDPADSPRAQHERAAVVELGLRFDEFPLPGDGCGDFDTLDAAADAIAAGREERVYFHCAAGVQRSNAALAAYRMRRCGWTLEQALAELEHYGLDPARQAKLRGHLERYWRERILPRRAPVTSAESRR